jgi:V/A-type H+-transporting ATPase subunit C
MNTKYVYAGTRAYALTNSLLNENQLERLLGAKSVDETHQVLQDTFLASYLARHDKSHLSHAIDESIKDAKNLLVQITPEPKLLEVLWIRYDFFNIRTLIKGKRKGLSESELLTMLYGSGTLEHNVLIKAVLEEKPDRLESRFANAVREANRVDQSYEVDFVTEAHYFEALREIVKESKDSFLKEYVSMLIDMFNVRSRLRASTLPEGVTAPFIKDGTISKDKLVSEETALKALHRYGGANAWSEAEQTYLKTGTHALVDKVAQETQLKFLKEASMNLFSLAPLFAYFTALKNNAQIIRAIVVAKEASIPELELRYILRRLYT